MHYANMYVDIEFIVGVNFYFLMVNFSKEESVRLNRKQKFMIA